DYYCAIWHNNAWVF
nr:immunoglobulin light chain junction region [Macaca mulatta]